MKCSNLLALTSECERSGTLGKALDIKHWLTSQMIMLFKMRHLTVPISLFMQGVVAADVVAQIVVLDEA